MSDQIADRKAKLDKLRQLGVDPYGRRFEGVTPIADIRAAAEKLTIDAGQILEPGVPGATFRAAGRVVLHRDIGSLIFMTVRDRTGELQFALSKKMVVGGGTEARRHEGTQGEAAGNRQQGTGESAGASPVRNDAAEGGAGGSPASSDPRSPIPDPPTAGSLFPAASTIWQVAKLLDLGDIVGAEGTLGRTKTGELTLWCPKLTILSKCLRPPPEKRLGLADVETRYRKRYIDLLSNPESRDVFLQRIRIIDCMREALRRRGFLEVETPVLQPIYGGAAARPFTTHHNTLDMKLYLRISPELYLKRLLVGGLERVFEFSRNFRNEGISPVHNPEFTMLELYQAYGDYHDMMEITEELVAGSAREVIGTYRIPVDRHALREGEAPAEPPEGTKARRHEGTKGEGTGNREQGTGGAPASPPGGSADVSPARNHAAQGGAGVSPASSDPRSPIPDPRIIDYTPPWPRRRYADLFAEHVGIAMDDVAAVRQRARELYEAGQMRQNEANLDDAVVINELFEHYVEPHLINPVFVLDYPAPLCPLTRRKPGDPSTALRFECYINGTEIGNAYTELNDPAVQRETLARQLRGEGDETMAVMDEDFIEALEYAMPPAGGLGIGIDRVVMLLTGSSSIRDVLLFPLQRPKGGGTEGRSDVAT